MAWPNTAHPGEPADSRPWHWVARVEDAGRTALPIGWNGALRQWMVWDGSTVGPEEAARRFTYLGPCLTPGEIKASLEAAKGSEPEGPPRGLAALVASATPPLPPAMVFRKDAIRNHLLIFAGTLAGALFLAEKIFGVKQ